MTKALHFFLSVVLFSLVIAACDATTDSTSNNNISENPSDVIGTTPPVLQPTEVPSANEIAAQPANLPESHDCQVDGEVYEGNQQWFRNKQTLVAITADESTFDESLGESHRILVAYNTEDCSEKFREVLPISISADYPYYLAQIDSLKGELIGILGSDRVYVYDVDNNKLSAPLNPEFKSNRQMEDAQSGAIMDIKTWGRYVIGYAEDAGSFVYNMTILDLPKQESAFAEHKKEEGDYSSLFLLKSSDADKQQIVVPDYDIQSNQFDVNPMLAEAAPVSQQINKSALDNRYIVLRLQDETRTPVAIDMQTSERIELPEDVKSKSTQEIIAWMKQR
ncbi:MAG: hypothetical protein AAGI23_10515 [Bacteroidota bacterium]